MVVDCFTFNGEFDLLEIHLNILNDFVDQFVIVEATKTFSGKEKPLYYLQQPKRFEKFRSKIIYYIIDDYSNEELWNMSEQSPNTVGAEHWKMEFYQKEHIKYALNHLKDDDVVFIGDVDEIWEPGIIGIQGKLKLDVYTYYLNNHSSEIFYGTITYPYKHIKDCCLNHLRTNSTKDDHRNGWHFTSIGGIDEVRRKLSDSYTSESYNTQEVQDKLESRFGKEDYLGRRIDFIRDESNWPQYLKDNRDKYKHLLI